MKIEQSVANAVAVRKAAIAAYADVRDLPTLEVMRELCTDRDERLAIELVISTRKREQKALFETYERWADFFDKASLPLAAAAPAFVAVLANEHVLVDPLRRTLVLASVLFGGATWMLCRLASFYLSRRAKVGAIGLGKVD